jgi:hypothetical protein
MGILSCREWDVYLENPSGKFKSICKIIEFHEKSERIPAGVFCDLYQYILCLLI